MIFIWIPKTGGTSLFSILKQQGYALYTEDYARYKGEEKVCFGHASLNSLLQLGYITTDIIKKSEDIYCVVRNPYDRFASLYKDFYRTKRIPDTWQPIDFAYSLQSGVAPIGAYNDFGNSQCNPQVRWIMPHTEIYYLEDLAEGFFNDLFALIEMPHLNADPTPFVWTPELRRLVNKIYVEDFAFLDYEMINE